MSEETIITSAMSNLSIDSLIKLKNPSIELFCFQQGYVVGFLNAERITPFDIDNINFKTITEDIRRKIENNYMSIFLNLDWITEIYKEEFFEGMNTGIHNGICYVANYSNIRRYHMCIKETYPIPEPFNKYHDLILKSTGESIGKLQTVSSFGIPTLFVQRQIKDGCAQCGFTEFCRCFSFNKASENMIGSKDEGESTSICVNCGVFDMFSSCSIKYGDEVKIIKKGISSHSSFHCEKCFEQNRDNIQLTDKRETFLKRTCYRQTFFKDKNWKCLACKRREINPYLGLMVCSDRCLNKFIYVSDYKRSK